MSVADKKQQHKTFWEGQGPSLILIPAADMDLYDTAGYAVLFDSPERMWQSEMKRAQLAIDWPTDGIPTVRPNLGVIFIPVITGQDYHVMDGQMPWPGDALSPEAFCTAAEVDIEAAEMMQKARAFYALHAEQGGDDVASYCADNQGAINLCQIGLGNDLLTMVMLDPDSVQQAMDTACDLYIRVTQHLKAAMQEPATEMIHGHGTPQGVYFPEAGVRMCEDAATLLSPPLMDQFIFPAIEKAAQPFGGVFVHTCGRQDYLIDNVCRMPHVKALDLGNPEMYDARPLLELCAETGTVLYSGIAVEPGEEWETYTRRLGALVQETGARCILRPAVFPKTREECAAMRDLWHELTA